MRYDTWPEALFEFVASRQNTPFAWGSHDCVLFAVDCAHAMTGVDYAAPYRGYDSEFGAGRILVEYGGLRQLATANMGPEIPPTLARRGDWCLIMQDGREALSVCMGLFLLAAGPTGLTLRPTCDAITAWRIE